MEPDNIINNYENRIKELENSIKSRDQRIDADSRILRQQKQHEVNVKQLRLEMTNLENNLQVEKKKELQKQKFHFE